MTKSTEPRRHRISNGWNWALGLGSGVLVSALVIVAVVLWGNPSHSVDHTVARVSAPASVLIPVSPTLTAGDPHGSTSSSASPRPSVRITLGTAIATSRSPKASHKASPTVSQSATMKPTLNVTPSATSAPLFGPPWTGKWVHTVGQLDMDAGTFDYQLGLKCPASPPKHGNYVCNVHDEITVEAGTPDKPRVAVITVTSSVLQLEDFDGHALQPDQPSGIPAGTKYTVKEIYQHGQDTGTAEITPFDNSPVNPPFDTMCRQAVKAHGGCGA